MGIRNSLRSNNSTNNSIELEKGQIHSGVTLTAVLVMSESPKFYQITRHTPYEGYIVSVHRMVMENRPVDPGNIQGSRRPMSFIRIKHRTRANGFFVKLSIINNHLVALAHKNLIIN